MKISKRLFPLLCAAMLAFMCVIVFFVVWLFAVGLAFTFEKALDGDIRSITVLTVFAASVAVLNVLALRRDEPPGPFRSWLRAKKEKVCPFVEYTEDK